MVLLLHIFCSPTPKLRLKKYFRPLNLKLVWIMYKTRYKCWSIKVDQPHLPHLPLLLITRPESHLILLLESLTEHTFKTNPFMHSSNFLPPPIPSSKFPPSNIIAITIINQQPLSLFDNLLTTTMRIPLLAFLIPSISPLTNPYT